ncbi:MAG: hypothetical protein AB7I35_17475 [Ramlibacter sp.]
MSSPAKAGGRIGPFAQEIRISAFTIFFCGTGSNSFDFAHTNYVQGELISTLARHHLGHEFVDWIIVDGPGSGNLQEAEKWVPPGNYSAIRGTLQGKGWEENVKHAVAVVIGSKQVDRQEHTRKEVSRLRSMGVGVHEAPGRLWGTRKVNDPLHVRISPQALQEKKRQILRKNKPITCINVIGWSRGGVTCHMFANALAETEGWSQMPVNIFACDPVPGAGQFDLERIRLQANVNEYVAVLAADERSRGFTPILPSLAPGTRFFVTTMPGRHATLVGNARTDGGDSGVNCLYGPGLVTRDLAEKYLARWGTVLDKPLRLTDIAILQRYDEMIGQAGQYQAMQAVSYTSFTQKGPRAVGRGDGTFADFATTSLLREDRVFVNAHHRAVFAARYPSLYQRLFESVHAPTALLEMHKFNAKMMYPNLYRRLFGAR